MLLKRLFGRRAEPKAPDAQQTQTQVATSLESTDVSVRRNACRQLTDLRRLRDLANTDQDAGMRELAEARYRRLLFGLDANAPSLETRLAELSCTANPSLLAQTAVQASDAELRLAAIERLEDVAVLANCATTDLVAANRLAAAERVQQKEALEQIAKAIGKRDKRVYRLVRERLKQLLEEAERPQRAREQGAVLCERLERLGRFDNWLQDRAVLGHLEQQWQAIEGDADQALRDRFQHLRQRFLDGFQTYQQAREAEVSEQDSQTARSTEPPVEDAANNTAEQRTEPPGENANPQQKRQPPQTTEQDAAGSQPALAQADQEAEQALQAQRRQLQQAAQTEQTAEQLLTDLRRHTEHKLSPDQRTLEALRKRRRRLPSQLAPADAMSHHNEPAANAETHTQSQTQSQTQLPVLQEIDQQLERLEQRFKRHQKQLMRKLEGLPERLTELETHLNAGELKKADPLYQSISATLNHSHNAGVGREILTAADERLKQIAPQLRELRQWRRWSTDEHRAQLCAQIEALAADTEHADEPSINRLEELKGDWQMLDRQGAPADDALWARFRQAAEQIRQRCQPYLEAQAALRSENRKQREALAKRLEDFLAKVDWERVDWKKLHRAEREMRQAWGRLIEAPGGDNQGTRDRAIEGRFRRALRRLDHSLAEERERNQAEKQQLLTQMRALADEPDLRRAIETAKQLQSQWQTTVPARHRDENALWQRFRAASDAIFARRAAEFEARESSLREHQLTREAICQDLLTLANAETIASSEALEQQISTLKMRWADTEALPVPRQAQSALNRQWREALAAVQVRLASLHEAERWAGLEGLAQRAAYCDDAGRQLTTAGMAPDCAQLEQGWSALPELEDAELANALNQAFDLVLSGCREPAQRDALSTRLNHNLALRESLCLSLEIITQVESPTQFQAERMQRQVERLRDRMADGETNRSEDINALLRDWYLSCPATASATLDARFERIKQALAEHATQSPEPSAP
ncbi:MAG: hypothetical protein C1943_08300 [Halochromatium sp.]|nr:hypothetical protein [Halochromatium sp.]